MRDLSVKTVGVAGFEPTAPTPPAWCATRLRYTPFFNLILNPWRGLCQIAGIFLLFRFFFTTHPHHKNIIKGASALNNFSAVPLSL